MAVWVALQLLTYGGVGVGGTVLYRRITDADASASIPTDLGQLAGLVAATVTIAVVAILAGGIGGVGAGSFVERFGRAAAVRGPTNPAPRGVVLAVVLATKVLVIAPAFGLVVHGVLQPSLRAAVGRAGAIVAVALLVAVAKTPLTPASVGRTPLAELALLAGVLVAVAVAVGAVYERTDTLAMPAIGYALFVVAMVALWNPPF